MTHFDSLGDYSVGQKKLRQLLDNLLQLQKMIFTKNKDTQSLVGTASDDCHGDSEAESDEEIASDSEEEIDHTKSDSQSESENQGGVVVSKERLSRKRRRPEWVTWIIIASQIDLLVYLKELLDHCIAGIVIREKGL